MPIPQEVQAVSLNVHWPAVGREVPTVIRFPSHAVGWAVSSVCGVEQSAVDECWHERLWYAGWNSLLTSQRMCELAVGTGRIAFRNRWNTPVTCDLEPGTVGYQVAIYDYHLFPDPSCTLPGACMQLAWLFGIKAVPPPCVHITGFMMLLRVPVNCIYLRSRRA